MKKQSKAEADLQDYEEIFAALAHASRRHILVVLQARGGRSLAGDIAKRFACSWPTTTRHLKLLEKARLVRVEKQGREVHYILDQDRLKKAKEWLNWF